MNDPSNIQTSKIQSEGEFQRFRFSSKFIHSIIGSSRQPTERCIKMPGYIFSPFNIFIFDLPESPNDEADPLG